MDFNEFPKIARLSRACTITEKIDGTNAQVHIRLESAAPFEFGYDTQCHIPETDQTVFVRAGSRTRWIKVGDDNHGFAGWVYQHAHELATLGVGAHFGEWWGLGIQRGYDQLVKRFSLFNTHRWGGENSARPACCDVVPVLFDGIFDTVLASLALERLQLFGSEAAPGFKNPEGIVIWHDAARSYFKKTLVKDEEWKGKKAA